LDKWGGTRKLLFYFFPDTEEPAIFIKSLDIYKKFVGNVRAVKFNISPACLVKPDFGIPK
jgi:hypothetical protein